MDFQALNSVIYYTFVTSWQMTVAAKFWRTVMVGWVGVFGAWSC